MPIGAYEADRHTWEIEPELEPEPEAPEMAEHMEWAKHFYSAALRMHELHGEGTHDGPTYNGIVSVQPMPVSSTEGLTGERR